MLPLARHFTELPPEHQGRSSDEDDEDDDDDGTDAMSRIDSLHLELKKSLEEAEADPAHFQLIESLISDHKQKMRNGIAHEGFPSALLEQGEIVLLLVDMC